MELDLMVNQPVVIDNGSGTIKAGFAGDDEPKCIIANLVGRPKHVRVMAGSLEGDTFIGRRAEEHRGLLSLKYPVEHGTVTDWNDMELIWQYIYSKEQLQTYSEDHPVLITEAPINPRRNRERTAEILFETFNVPALFISMQAVLALYASGRTTGVVLDSGDGVTQAVPIYEGFALPLSIVRTDVAGRDITRYLKFLLRKEGLTLNTTAEFEVVKKMKEQTCYVTSNPSRVVDELTTAAGGDEKMSYSLPDGSVVDIGANSRIKAPEILFQPNLIGSESEGISEVLVNSIAKSDLDLRKVFLENIVLSGGSTLFKGFGERLLGEVKKAVPKNSHIKIYSPPKRLYSTWTGGSILASLGTFKRMWVSKREYEEEGHRAIHRKTF
ncbi:Beta-centractin [Fragariocoptes setiger]|uniref:Beta-centractin n=1 Tax=Fragariocoptes setiger TaxID=1670756 RepID=A0ABQ7S5M4_9ACAR|nr:Beta-centractin [Fragariocoptes setiger]